MTVAKLSADFFAFKGIIESEGEALSIRCPRGVNEGSSRAGLIGFQDTGSDIPHHGLVGEARHLRVLIGSYPIGKSEL